MNEKMLFVVYFSILSISFICSLTIYFRKSKHTYLRFFPPFLLLTLIIETIALTQGASSALNKVYSVFCIITFIFYFFFFHRVIRSKLVKKVLIAILIGYVIFAVINLAFIQGLIYSFYNYNLAAIFIIGFCIYCFNEQFKTTTISTIIANPAFWICIGSLIFYACTFPIWAGTYVLLNVPEKEWVILSFVLDVANIILYSTFTMAFFCEVIFRKDKVNK